MKTSALSSITMKPVLQPAPGFAATAQYNADVHSKSVALLEALDKKSPVAEVAQAYNTYLSTFNRTRPHKPYDCKPKDLLFPKRYPKDPLGGRPLIMTLAKADLFQRFKKENQLGILGKDDTGELGLKIIFYSNGDQDIINHGLTTLKKSFHSCLAGYVETVLSDMPKFLNIPWHEAFTRKMVCPSREKFLDFK